MKIRFVTVSDLLQIEPSFEDLMSSLNDLRSYLLSKKTSEQIKARNFEIPGFGGFQLSQYSLGLEDFYDIDRVYSKATNTEHND